MTDLVKRVELTLYTVDGLELYFTHDREPWAHQAALARMGKCDKNTVKADIKSMGDSLDILCAQIVCGSQIIEREFYNSEVILTILEKRNPKLLTKFSRFGIKEGLAQMFGVPLPVATPQISTSELLQLAAKAALDMAAIGEHGKTNPGFAREIAEVTSTSPNTLSGSMTIREMCELRGISADKTNAQILGRLMSAAYRLKKENATVPKKTYSYKQKNGLWQTQRLGSYPIDMLVNFDSICAALNLC
jgi:hypothetical protein